MGLASINYFNSCSHLRKESSSYCHINKEESDYLKDKSLENKLRSARKNSLKELEELFLNSNSPPYQVSKEIGINKKNRFLSWTLLDRMNTEKPILVEYIGEDYESAKRDSYIHSEIIEILFYKRKNKEMYRPDFYYSIDLNKDGVITDDEFKNKLREIGYKACIFRDSTNISNNEIELIKENGDIEKSVLYK